MADVLWLSLACPVKYKRDTQLLNQYVKLSGMIAENLFFGRFR